MSAIAQAEIECATDADDAEYKRRSDILTSLIGQHLHDPVMMAALSATVRLSGGDKLLTSLDLAEGMCREAAQRIAELRDIARA